MQVSDAPSIVGPADGGIGHNRATIADIFRDRHDGLIKQVEALAKRANDARDKLPSDKISSDEERDIFVSIGVEAAKLSKVTDAKRGEETDPLRAEIGEWNSLFGTDKPVVGSLQYRLNAMKLYAQTVVGAYNDAQRQEAARRAAADAEAARLEADRKLAEAAAVPADKVVTTDIALNEAAAAEHRAKHLERQALAAGVGPTRTEAGSISSSAAWDFRIVDASKIDLNALRAHVPIADIEKAIRKHIKANRNTVPLAGVEFFQTSKTQFRG